MKKLFLALLCALSGTFVCAQLNTSVRMDGVDNNLRIGMDTIRHHWTVEAWVKPDAHSWKDMEVIIGGGEYSEQNISDHLPLAIRKGRLYNGGTGLQSEILPTGVWSHLAASCNGQFISIYINGKEVARKDTATSILPGSIGIHEKKESVFQGEIDEVRIWKTGLGEKMIKKWMNKSITPRHPEFKNLKGYYTFDDLEDDMSVNLTGVGRFTYHLRNGRNDYYGNAPLAYRVINDNPSFQNKSGNQQLFHAATIHNEWDADQGTSDYQLLKIRIVTSGDRKPLTLTNLKLDLSACTSLADIDKVHVYYTGQKPRSEEKTELFGTGVAPQSGLEFTATPADAFTLRPGVNYFLVTLDINKSVQTGNRLCGKIPSFSLNRKTVTPEEDCGNLDVHITSNSSVNPRILKVLDWNIWHGGTHLGKDGRQRIIELIKATNADVVLMQEGYGAQQMIADSLGYYLQTPSGKDNLVIYSRYPLEKIKTGKPFQSNPAIMTLPSGKKTYINSCWLRYAYRPEYTCAYTNKGLDPDVWVAEDSLYSLKDIAYIMENDVKPYVDSDMPIIIGGDFNSGSHLDWTQRASLLHHGYAAEMLPASRYMADEGFLDSFREIHPDEVKRGEGTFAVIFGNLQNSRIDYIYYKGKGIRAISSKIIRTTAEVDDVWPSDHAGVLTVFEIDQ